MEENMIVITDPKTFCFNFDLPKDVDKNLKREIEFIIKSNESLAEIMIKNEIEKLLLKYKHGNRKKTAENSKIQEVQINMLLSKLIYLLHVENIRKQYKNNKLKTIAPTWNDEFELQDGSYFVSDIQNYIEYIIKKHEKSTKNPPIHVHINRINNRLELQTLETVELFGSTKKLIDKTKTGEKVSSLEVVEVVFLQCNLVDNQYQQKSEVLYTFTPNKSYAYLLIVEPGNLVLLKTYNTGFDEIIIRFTDQKGRPLEIEDKIDLTLLINT